MKAVIRTKVDDGTETVQIDYRLLLRDGEWHVYDVIIENVGLVSNYRSEFAAIVQKDKMQGLLVKLRDKKAKRVVDAGKAA
jgi:phospholipid transport system substrate-binding protein